MKDLQGAIASLRKQVELSPRNKDAQLFLADLYFQAPNYDKAFEHYQLVLPLERTTL